MTGLVERLEPCPFCGGSNCVVQENGALGQRQYWEAACLDCDFVAHDSIDRANTVAAWNRRAAISALPAAQVTDAAMERAIDIANEHLEIDYDAEHAFIRLDSIDAAIRAVLSALSAPAMPDIAELRHKCAVSGMHEHDGCTCPDDELLRRSAPAMPDPTPPPVVGAMETIVDDAGKAAFVKAQSVYRADHDHFPLKSTWETTSESVRDGWREIAYAAIEAAYMPPLGTQPEPRKPRDVKAAIATPRVIEGEPAGYLYRQKGTEERWQFTFGEWPAYWGEQNTTYETQPLFTASPSAALIAERDEARAMVVAAWNAFGGHVADSFDEVYAIASNADGDLAEQITALTKQRDDLEAESALKADRLTDLRRLLLALGMNDDARSQSPASVFEECLAKIKEMRS